MTSASDAVLLTGATGFVGIELLARYLQLTDRDVVVLIRARDDDHARERLEETLVCAFGTASPYLHRVRALAGDITREGLGLDPDVALEVAGVGLGDRARRRVRLLRPAVGRLADRQRRGHAADARLRRAVRAGGRSAALHVRLDGVCRRHAPRHVSARTTSTSARASATPTSSRSSKRRSSCARRWGGCRSPSCGRASSSATGPAAGRHRSTSCTGRCARWRRAPTRCCRPRRAHRSTWCRWTTSPMRSSRSQAHTIPPARRTTSRPPRTRAASASCSRWRSRGLAASARRSSRRGCIATSWRP